MGLLLAHGRSQKLTRVHSGHAALLGDANFPDLTLRVSQGEKIVRAQNLWKVYCTLGFTHDYDRPLAIQGMFMRLLAAFKARGSFGVLDDSETSGDKRNQTGGLLRRMLLWYRSQSQSSMARIQFPPGAQGAPSWSWMAYSGHIEFLGPMFGGIDWAELEAPWSRAHLARNPQFFAEKETAFRGVLSNLAPLDQVDLGEKGKLYYDIPSENIQHKPVQCVILGTEREPRAQPKSRVHFFIIVRPVRSRSPELSVAEHAYERIGAGYLPGQYISSSDLKVEIY